MIMRGGYNKGVVIINASDEDVAVSADTAMDDGGRMTDGKYTDQALTMEKRKPLPPRSVCRSLLFCVRDRIRKCQALIKNT